MKILVIYEFRAKWHFIDYLDLDLEGTHKGRGI